jgi:cell surface protein SprA
MTFRGDITRQYGAYQARNVGGGKYQIPETFNKFFTIDRTYILRWDITRSLNIDFAALNKSWVDEDSGRLDNAQKKQMWSNFWKGGRTINYSQTANFTYTVPTNKIPALDWTTLRLG